MKIEILGTNCSKCVELEKNMKIVIEELKLDTEIVKITNMIDILKRGIIFNPGLIIDGEIKSMGYALTVEEIKDILNGKEVKKDEICDWC